MLPPPPLMSVNVGAEGVPVLFVQPDKGKVLTVPAAEYKGIPVLFTVVNIPQLPVPLYARKSAPFVHSVAPLKVALGAAQGT